MSFEEAVERAVKDLRPGETAAYGEIAEEAGRPGAARAVGNLLSRCDGTWPWWRVIRADGRLAAGKEQDQGRRLRAEGVDVRDGRVLRPRR